MIYLIYYLGMLISTLRIKHSTEMMCMISCRHLSTILRRQLFTPTSTAFSTQVEQLPLSNQFRMVEVITVIITLRQTLDHPLARHHRQRYHLPPQYVNGLPHQVDIPAAVLLRCMGVICYLLRSTSLTQTTN